MNAGRFHCIVATSIPAGKANSIRTGMVWLDLGYKTFRLNSDYLWQLFLAHANLYLFPSITWRKMGGPGQKDTEGHPTTQQCQELAPVFISVLLPFNEILQMCFMGICRSATSGKGWNLKYGATTEVYGFILRQCIKNYFETKVDMKNIDYMLTFLYAFWAGTIMYQSFFFLSCS